MAEWIASYFVSAASLLIVLCLAFHYFFEGDNSIVKYPEIVDNKWEQMWRYLEGANQRDQKQKLTDKERLEGNMIYDMDKEM